MPSTVTEPFTFVEVQVPSVTVSVNGIEPEVAAALRLTVIGPEVPGKLPLVTVVMPVPEMLY